MNLPRYLKIHLHSGIGDCIKTLTCNYPLLSLSKKYGTEIIATYGGEGTNDCGWESLIKNELINHIQGFSYVSKKEYELLKHPTVESFFKNGAKNLLLESYLPLQFKKTKTFLTKHVRRIAIQTDSNDGRKKYPIENWAEIIKEILKKHKNTHVYLFDAPKRRDYIDNNIDTTHERVYNMAGKELWESISLLQQMDLLISPDSYSKYIALCSRVPAILLCCELEYISVDDMLEFCFKGIYNNDNYQLLGLKYSNGHQVEDAVKDIKEINRQEIIDHLNKS